MAALLQWRKFNFFDVKSNIDGGKLSEAVKEHEVTCSGCGRGQVYLGDASGGVHILSRQLALTSFQAHSAPITSITAFDHSSIIVTVATGADGGSEVKVWAPEKADVTGGPPCLRTLCPDPRPNTGGSRPPGPAPKVTSLAVHPNMSLMVLGFTDGSIMVYRGEVSRDRGSKNFVMVTLSSGVTNLHLRHTTRYTHLFATTTNQIYCLNLTTKEKETTVELDRFGCQPGCSTLADGRHEHHFLVARPDAIYSYTSDSRGSCYVFEGDKSLVAWFRGYLIVAAKDKNQTSMRNNQTITVYDLTNKLVALSTKVDGGLAGVVGEWGGLYLITTAGVILHLSEKDLQTKFELLFKKNQFDIAISLAKTQCCDPEEVAEILRQYGDWLYSKGNHPAAMDQYLKTIPHLEPSYVIRKYLDTQHIHTLTKYLQALHQSGAATADHTSLLINCYTRLRDTQQLDEFIINKNGAVDCDVELGVRVCRSAGYFDHALALAAKHGLHHHHLAILIDDKKDFIAALRYITTLEFEEAKENVLRYGSVLLTHVPDDTTDLLIKLCTDYKPANQPIIREGSLDGYLSPEEPICCSAEDFEYLLVNHNEQAVKFLEKLSSVLPGRLSPRLYTTLLAEYLHQYSLSPEGQEQVTLGEKILELLRNPEALYERDHALLLCDKHQFHAGKLLLWEQAGMYEELLSWHAECGDMESVLAVCTRRCHLHPTLWVSALKLLTATNATAAPHQSHLRTVLDNIDNRSLLPPLEVVEQLSASPNITLGQVREYLLRVVSAHSQTLTTEKTRTEQYTKETKEKRDKINNIRTSATQFTATKCNICNNELELPSVHFLCHHSFHQHCFESYSESDMDCPVCLPENKKMIEVIKAQEIHRSQHDQFHEQLERSSDPFSVVAEYLGRGVFTHLHSLAAMYPSLNTTRQSDNMSTGSGKGSPAMIPKAAQVGNKAEASPTPTSRTKPTQDVTDNSEARVRASEFRPSQNPGVIVPESEGRIRAQERTFTPAGISSEGRLRSDGHSNVLASQSEARMRQDVRTNIISGQSEGRMRQEQSSNVLVSPTEGQINASMASNIPVAQSEARMRMGEGNKFGTLSTEVSGGRDTNRFGSSLSDHITPSPPVGRSPKQHIEAVESISASLSNTRVSQLPKPTASDNPFDDNNVEENNPFGEGFETEEISTNPFEEDNETAESNPFPDDSTDSKNPFGNDDDDNDNSFKDDKNDDYDPKLNPFG